MVEQRTLTPLVLVRVQVSQPTDKPLIFNGFFVFKLVKNLLKRKQAPLSDKPSFAAKR